MLTARWQAARREPGDAGMTLMELVVGMTLLVIVSAVALNFFVGTTAQANRVTAQNVNVANARSAMNQVVSLLRLADTPTSTPGYPAARFSTPFSATDFTFYSNVNTDRSSAAAVRTPPAKIELTLSGGTLTEFLTRPTNAYTSYPADYNDPGAGDGYSANYSGAATKTVLLSGLVNTTPFTFCSSATDPSTSCTVTTNAASVALVQITFVYAGKPGQLPQTLQSAVAITGAVS
jgi:prepilin-type N-terminal cleavage/methylation domain-containing protein